MGMVISISNLLRVVYMALCFLNHSQVKEIVEKLKGQGYLFKRPVEDSEYNKKRVKSAEFVESFNVWEKKK